MSILLDLRKLSSAEDFFAALDVDFDPAVLRVARLHILKRMGQYLAEANLEGLPEEQILAACKTHLGKAYSDFIVSSPIAERLFKVHQDAVKPKEEPKKPFVPFNLMIASDSRGL